LTDYAGVLAYGEFGEGKLSAITLELLSVGKKLADELGEHLSIVLIGNGADAHRQEAIAFGAEQVYVIDGVPVESYEGPSYATIIERLCRETARPAILLLGHTLTGRDLAPRLAFKLETGLVMDCIWLGIDPESKALLGKRPVAGGNVQAVYRVEAAYPQLATIRPKAMEPPKRDDSRRGEVLRVSAGINASAAKVKVLRRVREETTGPKLEDAEIIVSGGRGVGSPADFESYITQGLGKVLGAAVGGTRAAVDLGLITEQQQIGLTGKIVSPNLYFAIALSGAAQHISGCSGSKHIVAINKDENAPIFAHAEFGIVGDYKKVLPPLTEKLKQVLSG